MVITHVGYLMLVIAFGPFGVKKTAVSKIVRKDRRAKFQVNISYELCLGFATRNLAAYRFRANITFAQNCTRQKFAMCQAQGMYTYAWTGKDPSKFEAKLRFFYAYP